MRLQPGFVFALALLTAACGDGVPAGFPRSDGGLSVDSGAVDGGSRVVTFLSDWMWAIDMPGYGPTERNMSNGDEVAGDGQPIRLNGMMYAKGIGSHANSEIHALLNGKCSRLTIYVGVDDEITEGGSVIFQVFADSTMVFESPTMSATTETARVDVGLLGVGLLRLKLNDAGDGITYDHGDWADPRITCDAGWTGATVSP